MSSSFRRTAFWVVGTAVALFLLLTVAGAIYLVASENAVARSLLEGRGGAVAWIYARILLGYLAAGMLAAFVLHPFVKGRRAALATVGIALLGFVHTLTSETQLLYGPTQTLFCTVHDAIPAFVRDLYAPWLIEAALGLLALAALHRWTVRVPLRYRVGALAVAAALGALALRPPAAPEPREGPPCFLLIATDSLRADHLSCNGYGRDTSPHIDRLAQRGTNYARCLVPTASTHESWVATYSSTEPRDNGLRHMFPSRALVERVEREQTFFPAVLRERGYHTAAIGGWCGTTFGLFDLGFDEVDVSDTQNHAALLAEAAFTNHLLAAAFLDNPVGRLVLPELERVSFTRSAAALTGKARRYLERAARSDAPFFLTVVYHVNHLPYSASHPYYSLFTDPEYRGRNRYRIDFQIDEMIQRGFDHDLSEAERQHIVDLYDGCVREFDDQVGALVSALEEFGFADRTIVGVMADHGDDLYEHGTTLGHGVTLFGGDQANHIPAVFSGPGVPIRRVDELVRSVDLAPTWAGWLGIPRAPSWKGFDLRGGIPDQAVLLETSYLLYRQPVPDLEPGERVKAFPQWHHATFFDPEFDNNVVLKDEYNERLVETKCFAVRRGRWKLISVPGEAGPILRLFDLDADPECRRDVRREYPDVVRRLGARLPAEAQ